MSIPQVGRLYNMQTSSKDHCKVFHLELQVSTLTTAIMFGHYCCWCSPLTARQSAVTMTNHSCVTKKGLTIPCAVYVQYPSE